jgi:hypothetical protein
VVHREVAEPRARELAEGAVLLLRSVSCFSAGGAHHLNIVPAALAALFPADSALSANAFPNLPPLWRGLHSYERVPTRPKRPSSSLAERGKKKPVAAPLPPSDERHRQVQAARQALLRIPAVPNVVFWRVPEAVPEAVPAQLEWGEAEDALLLECARLAEQGAAANRLQRNAPASLSSSLSSTSSVPTWNDEDDAMLLELDLDTLVNK